MIGVVAAASAAYGVFLIWTATVFGWRGLRPGPSTMHRRGGPTRIRTWLVQAGLGEVAPGEFMAAVLAVGVAGGVLAYVLFGGLLPTVVAGLIAATVPLAAHRSRRAKRLAVAREAWPSLLEELRLLTGSVGRSVPQALFDVGRHAPEELRGAFVAAERHWLLTTDFERTMTLLKEQLADPTVDVIAETLVVAHEVGGGDLDRRLGELIEDRLIDLQGRKDAISQQAGVRFARRFVLLVPLGMTVAGLSIGSGRSAYDTPLGQLAVAAGLVAIVACWTWSGRLMAIPEEPRVFIGDAEARSR